MHLGNKVECEGSLQVATGTSPRLHLGSEKQGRKSLGWYWVRLFIYFERESRENLKDPPPQRGYARMTPWPTRWKGRAVRRVDNAELLQPQPNALLMSGQLCGSRMVGLPPKALLFPWLAVAFSSREPALASAGGVVKMRRNELERSRLAEVPLG